MLIWVWHRIILAVHGAPFGEGWLLLPSAVCMALATFVLGLAARRLLGPGGGAWLACLLSGTGLEISRVGLQLRYYALQYLLTALVLWGWAVWRSQTARGRRRWLLCCALALAMALDAFTSYAALFLLFGLFLVDAWATIRGRGPLSTLLPYPVAAVFYSPWLVAVGMTVARGGFARDLNHFIIPSPTLLTAQADSVPWSGGVSAMSAGCVGRLR